MQVQEESHREPMKVGASRMQQVKMQLGDAGCVAPGGCRKSHRGEECRTGSGGAAGMSHRCRPSICESEGVSLLGPFIPGERRAGFA